MWVQVPPPQQNATGDFSYLNDYQHEVSKIVSDIFRKYQKMNKNNKEV